MIALAMVCGAGVGLGLLLVVLGLRGSDTPPARRSTTRRQVVGDRWLVHTVVAFVAALLTWVLIQWIVGAAGAAAAAVLGPAGRRRDLARRDEARRTEAIAAWTENLRDTLSAAAGLEQAVVTTARNAPEAIRDEVARLASRLDRGQRLVPGLRELADDLADPAADLVVAALVTAAQRQARDLAPLLHALADSTRAQAEMRMRVHASRARVRTAARVVVGSLATFAGGLVLFNPRYLEPYRPLTGQLVLLLIVAVLTGSYLLMQQMARLDGPGRFLTRAPDQPVVQP